MFKHQSSTNAFPKAPQHNDNIPSGQQRIKNWAFNFGDNNRHNHVTILNAFLRFLENPLAESLDIPGSCTMNGILCDSKHPDVIKHTEEIKAIYRVQRSSSCGVAIDMLRAVTTTGEEYFFRSDDYSSPTNQLLSEIRLLSNAGTLPSYLLSHLFTSFA